MKTKTTKKKNPYVIIRAQGAGCFAGTLIRKSGNEVDLKDARRLWKWSGAASLSQLAAEGTKDPRNCMFPMPVDLTVLGVIEIITVTPEAEASIKAVSVWKK